MRQFILLTTTSDRDILIPLDLIKTIEQYDYLETDELSEEAERTGSQIDFIDDRHMVELVQESPAEIAELMEGLAILEARRWT